MTSQSMDPFRTGKLVIFNVSYDRDWHYFEIPAYVLIGIFGVSRQSLLIIPSYKLSGSYRVYMVL